MPEHAFEHDENKRQGLLARIVIGVGLLMVFIMTLHPDGVTGDGSQNGTMRLVHGVLISLIIFNAFAVIEFSKQFGDAGGFKRLGRVFYAVGVFGLLLGTIVSGFVQTDLAARSAAGEISASSFETLNLFASILNQNFIQFGIVAFGAAGLVWSGLLMFGDRCDLPFGIVGSLLSVYMIVGPLMGGYIDVSLMTHLTLAVVLWHSAFAIWFSRKLQLQVQSQNQTAMT